MTADEVRSAMSIDAELLKLADALKDQFGARLVWLKTADVEIGRRASVLADDEEVRTSLNSCWGDT